MHTPRKRFGQNFLHDEHVIQRIIQTIAPNKTDVMVEIGPGQGALTKPLLNKLSTLDVIELDRDLIPYLEKLSSLGQLNIHAADALAFDFASLHHTQLLRIVGNLPYNISTPLIFHLLTFANIIDDMHFMLQKEVVERLAARRGETHYGRLSVMVQYYCEVVHVFDVPPTAFTPQPKVDSSIVRLRPHRILPFIATNHQLFANLVKQAFSQRRKTLRNCLKKLVSDELFQEAAIDSQLRAEQISIADFVTLSNLLNAQS